MRPRGLQVPNATTAPPAPLDADGGAIPQDQRRTARTGAPSRVLGRADILHAEVRALFRGNPKSPDRTTTPLVVTSTRAAAKLNRTHVVRAAKTVIEPPKTDSASKAA